MSESFITSIRHMAQAATDKHERRFFPAEMSRLQVLAIARTAAADFLMDELYREMDRRRIAQERLLEASVAQSRGPWPR